MIKARIPWPSTKYGLQTKSMAKLKSANRRPYCVFTQNAVLGNWVRATQGHTTRAAVASHVCTSEFMRDDVRAAYIHSIDFIVVTMLVMVHTKHTRKTAIITPTLNASNDTQQRARSIQVRLNRLW